MDITITPAEMKALEGRFMTEHKMPGALLMEHAAQGVAAALSRRIPGGQALFLCGPGNNGGDGYAAARLWQAQGGKSLIVELSPNAKGDAALNRTLAQLAGIPIHTPLAADALLPTCDAVVDALFGTGLSKPVEGTAALLIAKVQASGKPVIAVDIPSGLDGTTGAVLGRALPAVETVTFHRIKSGLVLGQGAIYAGKITVQPILIPADYGTQDGMHILQPDDLTTLIRPRPVAGHKGTFGRAVIIAGSMGMAGAAAFAANACIKTGAGLTTIVCPRDIIPIMQTLAPGATCIPLMLNHLSTLDDLFASASVIAFGCGCGKNDDLSYLFIKLVQVKCPVVLDADALNILGVHCGVLDTHPCTYLTPHPAEAARLLSCPTSDVTANPLLALRRLHDRTGANVLLKGARTLMSDGKHTAVNLYGTPAMAKGGSGDVLTGILTGLLAQRIGSTPLETLQLGALIHGLAGLRAEKQFGENCVTPQDLITAIRLDAQGI